MKTNQPLKSTHSHTHTLTNTHTQAHTHTQTHTHQASRQAGTNVCVCVCVCTCVVHACKGACEPSIWMATLMMLQQDLLPAPFFNCQTIIANTGNKFTGGLVSMYRGLPKYWHMLLDENWGMFRLSSDKSKYWQKKTQVLNTGICC